MGEQWIICLDYLKNMSDIQCTMLNCGVFYYCGDLEDLISQHLYLLDSWSNRDQ